MSDIREALQEAVDYLNGDHGMNSIGANSILHKKMKAALETAEPEPLWSADDKLLIRGFIARILAGWDESPTHYRRAIQWLSMNRDRFINKVEMDAAYNSIRGEHHE